MAHLIDMTTGRAAIAYRGETPWHGLGNIIVDGDDRDTILKKGGIAFNVKRAFVRYATAHGQSADQMMVDKDNVVLFRDDTGARLGIASDSYKVVQPSEVLDTLYDLVDQHGYQIETVGSLKDGRQVWALAKSGESADIGGGDVVRAYLLASTSFDGSRATQLQDTSIRVVCNNTIELAYGEKGVKRYSVSHRSTYNRQDAHRAMHVGAFSQYVDQAYKMSQVQLDPQQIVPFLLQAYHGLSVQDVRDAEVASDKGDAKATRLLRSTADTLSRLSDILVNAPGQQMKTAKGTLWGVVNAVTYDVDHLGKSRTADNRLTSAWYGAGNELKTKVWNAALQASNDVSAVSVDGGELFASLLGKAA